MKKEVLQSEVPRMAGVWGGALRAAAGLPFVRSRGLAEGGVCLEAGGAAVLGCFNPWTPMPTRTSFLACRWPLVSVNCRFSAEAGFRLSQTRDLNSRKLHGGGRGLAPPHPQLPLQKRPRLASWNNANTQAPPGSLRLFPCTPGPTTPT